MPSTSAALDCEYPPFSISSPNDGLLDQPLRRLPFYVHAEIQRFAVQEFSDAQVAVDVAGLDRMLVYDDRNPVDHYGLTPAGTTRAERDSIARSSELFCLIEEKKN